MRQQFKSDFQVNSFKTSDSEDRHIVLHRASKRPAIAASLYEVHLKHKTDSHNSRHKDLLYLGYLYTWATLKDIDIESKLLKGLGLIPAEIRSFSSWVKEPKRLPNGSIPQESRKAVNDVLRTCSKICVWFIAQFSNPTEDLSRRAIEVELLVQSQLNSWKEVLIKERSEDVAPDLTDEEISLIETYLNPASRSLQVGQKQAVRDYLIWRLAIEFGLRIGEILAMRMEDCPSISAPYLRIIRVEERGPDYKDPRRVPQRPKTLSRELGFLLKNSVIPKLFAEYSSTHRYGSKFVNGKKRKLFLLSHEFLIVAESGAPLSSRSADDVARNIRKATGVQFNWHLARHAFFNRAYANLAAETKLEKRVVDLKDLIYWGGWECESSLDIYTRRARKERAQYALVNWQKGAIPCITVN